jgi:hypothetical protein
MAEDRIYADIKRMGDDAWYGGRYLGGRQRICGRRARNAVKGKGRLYRGGRQSHSITAATETGAISLFGVTNRILYTN